MLRTLLADENGFLVSAELVLVFTLVFCAVAVGVSVIRDSLVLEFGDVARAIGTLDQSYNYRGILADLEGVGTHAVCSGSGFNDEEDDCDNVKQGITLGTVTGKKDPSTLDRPEASGQSASYLVYCFAPQQLLSLSQLLMIF